MKTATNMLSTGQYATASLIFPMKESIIQQVGTISDTDAQILPAVHECKMRIKHNLEERYLEADGTNILFLQECSALDPRYLLSKI